MDPRQTPIQACTSSFDSASGDSVNNPHHTWPYPAIPPLAATPDAARPPPSTPPAVFSPNTPARRVNRLKKFRYWVGTRYHPVMYKGILFMSIPHAPPRVNLHPSNFNHILQQFQQALRDQGSSAFRIGVTIPTVCLDWANFLDSVWQLLVPFTISWAFNPDTPWGNKVHLLGVAIRPGISFAVIEINNFGWDFFRAHVQSPLMPVYTLDLMGLRSVSMNLGHWRFVRDQRQDQRVLDEVQTHFRRHGYAPTPLLDVRMCSDCVPVYPSPRP